MKKRTEKQPIDDLFARKLRDISLPVNSNGFERLQARMGQLDSEPRVVFWRNPSIQRYVATAACLLIVSSFGWLYWTSESAKTAVDSQPVVASKANSPDALNLAQDRPKELERASSSNIEDGTKLDKSEGQIAAAKRTTNGSKINNHLATPPAAYKTPSDSTKPEASEFIAVQTKSVDDQHKSEVTDNVTPINQPVNEQVAEVKTATKLSLPAERVLTVTIDEPAALVAARQAAKTPAEKKTILAKNDTPEKETRSGGLWQQVKRIKHGEVFAKRDNTSDDERGLLDRAYNGLKNSLDKDKTGKQ
ncbi:hypothetical protein [Spirosoma sp.]|uniref:hypothetical protein n=1 Tax=Spirosoma sp. TaxID=1899569 RepID=UPI003B39FB7F